jgi:hypothetical protein
MKVRFRLSLIGIILCSAAYLVAEPLASFLGAVGRVLVMQP